MNFLIGVHAKLLTFLAGTGDTINDILEDTNVTQVEEIAHNALTVITWVGITLFVILLAVCGIKIMISNQNGEETQKNKQSIKTLILGAAICGFASLIAGVINAFIGW